MRFIAYGVVFWSIYLAGCSETEPPLKTPSNDHSQSTPRTSSRDADPKERTIHRDSLVNHTVTSRGYEWHFTDDSFELKKGDKSFPDFVTEKLSMEHRDATTITGTWSLDNKTLTLSNLQVDREFLPEVTIELLIEGDGPVSNRLMIGDDVHFIQD